MMIGGRPAFPFGEVLRTYFPALPAHTVLGA